MRERLRVAVRGAVQGVGFRPFVYRLARGLSLDGWVTNTPQGVWAEFEGERAALEQCLLRLTCEAPPRAVVQSLEPTWLDPTGFRGFEIRESRSDGVVATLVMPDIATCPACLAEIRDRADRRYRYPFTNCTNCGPRFSLIESLPYDRARTSMRRFTMCPSCQREYDDPADRRFQAQPNACPVCGPRVQLWSSDGAVLATGDDALRQAARAIAEGRIAGLKGLGGFQLIADAADGGAVARLRARKHREEKPFAIMCPSMAAIEALCEVGPLERRLLEAPEAPIVLMNRAAGALSLIDAGVAPGCAHLGVMLPYTPLHHLLLADVGRAVVCTSGNLSDEPMVIDEHDAVERLGAIVDLFLVHDRPIVRHVDDSIARVVLGRELVLRRARGYAPLPIDLAAPVPPMLAVGGHLKSAVAVTAGRQVFISQHLGDLEHERSQQAFLAAQAGIRQLLAVTPELVAADTHDGYVSTRFARATGLPVAPVPHHLAHVAACMAENALEPPVLGVSWDGTGDGQDGTIWGGEFLHVTRGEVIRAATLRPFRLPGGEQAVREPRRSALGALFALVGEAAGDLGWVRAAFSTAERLLLLRALARGLNAPVTTSAGRLFDAVAALTDLCHRMSFEGQAAMAFEAAVDGEGAAYPFVVLRATPADAPIPGWRTPTWIVDWAPMLHAVIDERAAGARLGTVASRVHSTLAAAIAAVAVRVGEPRVVLTGGCFQNRVLTERTVRALTDAGVRAYWHQRVPPNDGGLALGQVAATAWRLAGARPVPHSAGSTLQPHALRTLQVPGAGHAVPPT